MELTYDLKPRPVAEHGIGDARMRDLVSSGGVEVKVALTLSGVVPISGHALIPALMLGGRGEGKYQLRPHVGGVGAAVECRRICKRVLMCVCMYVCAHSVFVCKIVCVCVHM